MGVEGKYELIRSENVFEHMTAIGVPEEKAKSVSERSKHLEISFNGDKVTISRSGDREAQTYTLDQETEEDVPDGTKVKTTATLDGEVLTVVSRGSGREFKRTITPSGSELIVALSSSKEGVPVAKRFYKRV